MNTAEIIGNLERMIAGKRALLSSVRSATENVNPGSTTELVNIVIEQYLVTSIDELQLLLADITQLPSH